MVNLRCITKSIGNFINKIALDTTDGQVLYQEIQAHLKNDARASTSEKLWRKFACYYSQNKYVSPQLINIQTEVDHISRLSAKDSAVVSFFKQVVCATANSRYFELKKLLTTEEYEFRKGYIDKTIAILVSLIAFTISFALKIDSGNLGNLLGLDFLLRNNVYSFVAVAALSWIFFYIPLLSKFKYFPSGVKERYSLLRKNKLNILFLLVILICLWILKLNILSYERDSFFAATLILVLVIISLYHYFKAEIKLLILSFFFSFIFILLISISSLKSEINLYLLVELTLLTCPFIFLICFNLAFFPIYIHRKYGFLSAIINYLLTLLFINFLLVGFPYSMVKLYEYFGLADTSNKSLMIHVNKDSNLAAIYPAFHSKYIIVPCLENTEFPYTTRSAWHECMNGHLVSESDFITDNNNIKLVEQILVENHEKVRASNYLEISPRKRIYHEYLTEISKSTMASIKLGAKSVYDVKFKDGSHILYIPNPENKYLFVTKIKFDSYPNERNKTDQIIINLPEGVTYEILE